MIKDLVILLLTGIIEVLLPSNFLVHSHGFLCVLGIQMSGTFTVADTLQADVLMAAEAYTKQLF